MNNKEIKRMKPHKLPRQEDVDFINLDNKQIALVKLTEENRSAMLEIVLSSYLGEECKFCHEIFNTIQKVNSSVWCPWEKGRIAHKECWNNNNND